MRDPGLAAVLSAVIPGVGQFYNGRILAGISMAHNHAGALDRDGRFARLDSPPDLGLHRLHLRPRSSGAHLTPRVMIGFSRTTGMVGRSQRKDGAISEVTLWSEPASRRRSHPGTKSVPGIF
jgi:hypothetical protein